MGHCDPRPLERVHPMLKKFLRSALKPINILLRVPPLTQAVQVVPKFDVVCPHEYVSCTFKTFLYVSELRMRVEIHIQRGKDSSNDVVPLSVVSDNRP